MNPPAISTQYSAVPINTAAPSEVSDPQPRQAHPTVLPRAMMSLNTQSALDQVSAQTDVRHQLVASLVDNGLSDGTLLLQSGQDSEAHYGQPVTVPNGYGGRTIGNLDVRAKLNENTQYDIINAQLHVPSSGATASISLSGPPPPADPSRHSSAATDRRLSSGTNLSMVSNPALMRELIERHNPQDVSGEPLPSGDSVSTRSTVFSHDGSTGVLAGAPGPSRPRPAHAARSAPYPATSLSSRPGATSEGKQSKRPGATDAQISEHLHNDDGSLRTMKEVASALHAAGLGADNTRIVVRLQAAGGARHLQGATDAQIAAHLHNADGSLRTMKGVASALHAVGLGASNHRIAMQLKDTRGTLHLQGATNAQIAAHLRNADGSLRTTEGVGRALRGAGLGARNDRILALLQTERR